jgi:hypothetical protein
MAAWIAEESIDGAGPPPPLLADGGAARASGGCAAAVGAAAAGSPPSTLLMLAGLPLGLCGDSAQQAHRGWPGLALRACGHAM